MTTQTEAERLLEHMDDEWPEDWDGRAIRAELRRQQAEIERLEKIIAEITGGGGMSTDIKTHLANDLEQSAEILDSREFDEVQLDNCASVMRYAATVIRQDRAIEAAHGIKEKNT